MIGGFWRNALTVAAIAWLSPVHSDAPDDRLAAVRAASSAWAEQAAAEAVTDLARRTLHMPAVTPSASRAAAGDVAGAAPTITAAARRELERLSGLAARAP